MWKLISIDEIVEHSLENCVFMLVCLVRMRRRRWIVLCVWVVWVGAVGVMYGCRSEHAWSMVVRRLV